jgi:hypothetical protein
MSERLTKDSPIVAQTRVVDWCPGNATRYRCVLAHVKEPNGTGAVLLTLLHRGDTGGPSFLARDGQCPDVGYFSEKTGCNDADSAALLALLKHECGCDVYMPAGFNEFGCPE